ncbi:unnamed protein product [Pieris brassicae]|uniref:Peptidase S1 domain-containing protein n=1 Tax=Pieris brassicae TaxID=7116 RepID=A0A9P0TQR9_PIEBR|nr:unnamed protein product [Pieris brassicae]
MKSLVVLAGLLALVSSEPILKTSAYNYHANIGIPKAEKLAQIESAIDFDGARIVGGEDSVLGRTPHLGGIIISLTNGKSSVCGSSLLSNTKAVTSAHCWWDGTNQARRFTIVFGSVTLFSGGVRVNTEDVLVHPLWNPSNVDSDVAIATIMHVNYNDYVKPIALYSGDALHVGTWAWTAGYGTTSDSQTSISQTTSQKHVSLRVISNAECRRTFRFIADTVICVTTQKTASTCAGDSGGPLDIGEGDERTLIGINSFTHTEGCQHGHPVAFSRVSSFYAWINSRLSI